MRAPTRPSFRAAIVAATVLSASLVGPGLASADPTSDEAASSQDETTTEEAPVVPDEDSSTSDSQETDDTSSAEEQPAPEEEVVDELPVTTTPPAPSHDEAPADSTQEEVPDSISESESEEPPTTVESSEDANDESEDVADVAVAAEPTKLPPEYWNYGDLLEDGSPAENNFVAGNPTGLVSYAVVDGNIVLTAEGDTRIGVVYGTTGSDAAPTGVLIEPGQSITLPPTLDRETLYVVQAPKNGEGQPVILGAIYVYPDGTYDLIPYEEGGVVIPVTEEDTDPGENPGGETPGGETPGGETPGNGGPEPETPPAGGGSSVNVVVSINNVTVNNVTIVEGYNYFENNGYGYDCTYANGQLVVNNHTDLATGEEFVGAPEGQSFTTGVMPVVESSDSLPSGVIAAVMGTVLVAGVSVGVGYAVYRRRKASDSDPATYAL